MLPIRLWACGCSRACTTLLRMYRDIRAGGQPPAATTSGLPKPGQTARNPPLKHVPCYTVTVINFLQCKNFVHTSITVEYMFSRKEIFLFLTALLSNHRTVCGPTLQPLLTSSKLITSQFIKGNGTLFRIRAPFLNFEE